MHAKRLGSLLVLAILVWAPAVALAGDNPFPLGKNAMPEWFKASAPLPSGFTLGWTKMSDEMVISDLVFNLRGQTFPPGVFGVDNVTHHTTVETMRFDTWVLPFLDVYALRGVTNGTAPGVQPYSSLSSLPLPSGIDVKYDGTLYGVGATLAVSARRVFASYDVNKEWVTINLFTNKVQAVSQGIRAGVRGKLGGSLNAALYAGGFHLSLGNTPLTGSSFIPGAAGSFSLVARPKSAWNTIVGGSIELTRHMVITAEAGLGTRKQFTVMPGVRF